MTTDSNLQLSSGHRRKGIYEQQTELLAIDDAGPAVKQRAERDVQWARQVMVDLGVLLPTPDTSNLNGASNE